MSRFCQECHGYGYHDPGCPEYEEEDEDEQEDEEFEYPA
jgi:hypothetical protein